MDEKHGFPRAVWDQAKTEMRTILVNCARERKMITYSQLVGQVTTIQFKPRDVRLDAMLSEISTEEDTAGRGLLSAAVVHKLNEMRPGDGFFELAKQRKRDASDIDKCWLEELRRVWAKHGAT
jgi:hypothetical protein